ncbi:TPM domain-containing protein [Aeromicrobium erythreum]|nr:TPM domain-containing protein [Aeromicrobium erythreum]
MPRFVRRALAVTSALLALGVVGVVGVEPAAAEEPVDVSGQITDRADALGADRPQVQAALDRYYRDTGRQLFVVYVRTFDGLTGAEWATRTAERSGLGRTDVLLAVALESRSYGYDADSDELSDADLEKVDREYILPALRQDDWAGAATGAARGLTDVDRDTGIPWGWVVGGTAVVAAGAAYGVHRSRRRFDHTHPVVDEHGQPVDPAAILDDDELEAAVAEALVVVDDALQTADQEVGFAEAQFGEAAAADFRRTVVEGRATLREAFTLRQRLDDAEPETDAERRVLLSRVLHLCDTVDDALDAQVERLDALRDLQTRAPEVADTLQQRLDAVVARLAPTAETLRALQSEHAGSALAAVSGNVIRAESLTRSATEQLSQARAALGGSDHATAAVRLRTAEEATGQAVALLDAVDTARDDLAHAADAADDLLAQVTATVSAVSTYVETHRGAVGSTARTRLSEAGRLLDAGRQAVDSDPEEATRTLERAAGLVKEAQTSAEADVAAWRASSAPSDDLSLGGILGGLAMGSGSRGRVRRSGRTTRSSRRTASRRTRSPRSTSRRSRRSGGGRF